MATPARSEPRAVAAASLVIKIPGPPVAWSRAADGPSGRVNPGDMKAYVEVVRNHAAVAARLQAWIPPNHAPVGIQATFRIPKGASRLLPNGWFPGGPDIDNLSKLILDALSKVIYADDRQVASLTVWKVAAFDRDAGVQITVTRLP